MREILADPGPLSLRGFAVGDGCMGTEVLCGSKNPDKGPFYRVEFLHGHGQVSERNYRSIRMECPEAVLRSGSGMSTACNATLAQMEANVGGFFGYSLYDDCVYVRSRACRSLAVCLSLVCTVIACAGRVVPPPAAAALRRCRAERASRVR